MVGDVRASVRLLIEVAAALTEIPVVALGAEPLTAATCTVSVTPVVVPEVYMTSATPLELVIAFAVPVMVGYLNAPPLLLVTILNTTGSPDTTLPCWSVTVAVRVLSDDTPTCPGLALNCTVAGASAT